MDSTQPAGHVFDAAGVKWAAIGSDCSGQLLSQSSVRIFPLETTGVKQTPLCGGHRLRSVGVFLLHIIPSSRNRLKLHTEVVGGVYNPPPPLSLLLSLHLIRLIWVNAGPYVDQCWVCPTPCALCPGGEIGQGGLLIEMCWRLIDVSAPVSGLFWTAVLIAGFTSHKEKKKINSGSGSWGLFVASRHYRLAEESLIFIICHLVSYRGNGCEWWLTSFLKSFHTESALAERKSHQRVGQVFRGHHESLLACFCMFWWSLALMKPHYRRFVVVFEDLYSVQTEVFSLTTY